MSVNKLALFGGAPVREKEFRSCPCIGDEEINLVTHLMKTGSFSRFIGSPVKGTRTLLKKKSADLVFEGNSSCFLGGEYVRRFEAAWGDTVKADYCISVNSATSGLTAALLAVGIEPGQEVITTPFSFTATATAIVSANAIPVFCDIDLETFCLSPEALENCITPHSTALVPVHWCGNAGDFNDNIAIADNYALRIIEDAAQAPGTVYQGKYLGTYGDAGVFSFNQPKNIMTGEGGMIVTDDLGVAEKCRLIRNHGESIPDAEDPDDYIVNAVGYNFRLVEILAAIGYLQTLKLPRLHAIRDENYRYLRERLVGLIGEYIVPQRITHPDSYYAYTAAFRWLSERSGIHRNIVAAALRAEGIPVATGIPRLMCDHPMFLRKLAYGKKHYPWNPDTYKGNVNYDTLSLPNARTLQEQYLGFFQMGWPNKIEDMQDIITAFDKIMTHKNILKSLPQQDDNTQFFVPGR